MVPPPVKVGFVRMAIVSASRVALYGTWPLAMRTIPLRHQAHNSPTT